MIKLLLWHKCIYETNAPKESSSSKIQYIKISENKAYSNHINKETTLKKNKHDDSKNNTNINKKHDN